MKMILNNKANELIDVSSYSRSLNIPDTDVRFNLDLNFSGDYSANGVEYLANYANTDITSIKIYDDSDENGTDLLVTGTIRAKLTSLNEVCGPDGRYGSASMVIYENN